MFQTKTELSGGVTRVETALAPVRWKEFSAAAGVPKGQRLQQLHLVRTLGAGGMERARRYEWRDVPVAGEYADDCVLTP